MAKDPPERFSSANELSRTLIHELAELQAKAPDLSLEEAGHDLIEHDLLPTAGDRMGHFEINETDDEPTLAPIARETGVITRLATPTSTIRRLIPTLLTLMLGVIVLIAVTYWLPELEQNVGAEWQIVLLLIFAGLAVLTWFVMQLLPPADGLSSKGHAKGGTLGRLRNRLMAGALVLGSYVAFLEWSAYADASRELRTVGIVASKHAGSYTRREIEAMIGCLADDPSRGANTIPMRVAYRWEGSLSDPCPLRRIHSSARDQRRSRTEDGGDSYPTRSRRGLAELDQ